MYTGRYTYIDKDIFFGIKTREACVGSCPYRSVGGCEQGIDDVREFLHLLAGEYDQFLEGRAGADSLPDSYREQLLTGYRQFMAQQQEKRDGITAVSVSNVRTDSLDHYTSVFLLLCYGDSTQEEIVVPMVVHNGSWRMK